MKMIGQWIGEVLKSKGAESTLKQVRTRVRELCKAFPLYGHASLK